MGFVVDARNLVSWLGLDWIGFLRIGWVLMKFVCILLLFNCQLTFCHFYQRFLPFCRKWKTLRRQADRRAWKMEKPFCRVVIHKAKPTQTSVEWLTASVDFFMVLIYCGKYGILRTYDYNFGGGASAFNKP